MKAIFTGGGTGGHIYPALAVALGLKKQGWDVYYIGSVNGLEKDIVPANNIEFMTVDSAPLPRKISPELFQALYTTVKGFFQAYKLIKDINPDIVFGTGGFVAGPVVQAASIAGYTTMIHEQNVYPGITNKILSYSVDKIALNFKDAQKYFSNRVNNKFVVTGNPIRDSILKANRKQSLKELSLKSNKKTILVFGGSQGSMSINKAMIKVCQYYFESSSVQIVYITGEKNYNEIKTELEQKQIEISPDSNINLIPYLHNMEWAYAVADLVVYRAGATGLAEITAKGIPAILIPYPYATADHQKYNAKTLEKNGAAVVIFDQNLNGKLLLKNIKTLVKNDDKLKEMKKNSKAIAKPKATQTIIEKIKNLVS